MKAKIRPRINLENRTRLEKVIPLSIPFVLFVDPSSVCNLMCQFCPNSIIENKKIMGFDLFKKIINDLKEFNKTLKVLRLYKSGEPLLNKRFSDMIRYAKSSQLIQNIDTTTNGVLLNPELSRDILDAGLNRINISVNGMSDRHYLEFTSVRIDFNKYINNIRNFYEIREANGYDCEICIKITGDFLSDKDKEHFYQTFGDYADRIFIETAAPCWPGFDVENNAKINISKTKGIYDNELTSVQTCPYIFYSTTVNSDGTVSLCFLDWDNKLIIGNVIEQSIKEIWNGDTLYNYQTQNLNGERKENLVCRNCGQLKYCMPDNIDPYTNILKERLLNMKGD
jgi:radical SAM protein with 4Fe4S-binding SPASM domain